MENNLQKIIDLARTSKSRLIIFDKNDPDQSFVIMSLDEFAKVQAPQNQIQDLTEEELIDKINRDISLWKTKDANENFVDEIFDETEDPDDEFEEDESLYYYDEPTAKFGVADADDLDKWTEESVKKSGWTIPEDIKKNAESIE